MVTDILDAHQRHWTLTIVVVSPYPRLSARIDLMTSPAADLVRFNVDYAKIPKRA